ncbi:MAG: hypothetical protein ACJA1B_002995 [Polaribacter sp.]|jgi:hypothetical protein
MTYLLHELIIRTIAKKPQSFFNFSEKIRICLSFPLTPDDVCNKVGEDAKRISGKPQQEIILKTDLLFR